MIMIIHDILQNEFNTRLAPRHIDQSFVLTKLLEFC